MPASDLDLAQKLELRRAYRAADLGTRINVLLADVSEGHNELTPKSYTDVDVMGVAVLPDFRTLYSAAYCTTAHVSSERVFWLRGVSEYLGGASAFLVARQIPSAARSLCVRNDIIAMTESELGTFREAREKRLSRERLALEATLEPAVERYARALRTLPRSFDPLVAYRDYLFLQFDPGRNLQLASGYLRLPTEWQAKSQVHLALLLDLAQLYAIALLAACRYVLSAGLSDLPMNVTTFLAGGSTALREKGNFTKLVGKLLDDLASQGVEVTPQLRESIRPVPAYSSEIAVLVQSLLDRPAIAQTLPWYLETLQLAAMLGESDLAGALADAGRSEEDVERSLKMSRDIVALLVRQSGLRREFLDGFDRLLAPAPGRPEPQKLFATTT